MAMNKAYLVKRAKSNLLGEAQSFLITPEKVLLGPNGNVISVIKPDNLEERVNKTDINVKGDPSKLKKILVNGEKYKIKVYKDKNGIVQVVPYDNKVFQRGKDIGVSLALIASLLGYVLINSSCKDTPTTPKPPPTTPKDVVVNAYFRNHTQGGNYEKKYYGKSGEELIIKVSDVNVPNTDSKRIAVRKAANGGYLGELIGFSRNKEVKTTYPNQGMSYDVFLMNIGPTTKSEHYQKIDDWVGKGGGTLEFQPNMEWHREDKHGKTGPEGPINDAIRDLSNAVNYSWAKYGSLTKVGSGGNFGVGYADLPPGWGGDHTSDWAGVDYALKSDDIRLKLFLAEIFELITRTKDIYDGERTYPLITDPITGHLNEIGRDLFAYVFVKDTKTASSSLKSGFSIKFF